jgi:hypothetical protein
LLHLRRIFVRRLASKPSIFIRHCVFTWQECGDALGKIPNKKKCDFLV